MATPEEYEKPKAPGGVPLPGDPVDRLALMAPIEGVERALLAFAVHPEGGAFERAHLLLHDPHQDALVAWSGVVAGEAGESLDAAMFRAAMAPEPAGADPGRPRSMRWTPEELEGVASLAWRAGVALDGAPHAADGEACEGALRLECGRTWHGLLLGAWVDSEDSEARRRRLERMHRLAARLLSAWSRHEVARRAARQTDGLSELARCGVSSRNVAEVLHEALSLVAADDGSSGSAIWMRDATEDRAGLRLSLTGGAPEAREQEARSLESLAAQTVRSGEALWCDRAGEGMPEMSGAIARLALLPLVAYERTNGVLAVWSRAGARPDRPGPWQPTDRAFLSGVADLLALAFDQAERCDRLRLAEQRADELKRRLRHVERLAARGLSALEAADAARNPIVSITAFARRLQGSFDPSAPEREYLEVVLREAERVERMLGERRAGIEAAPPGLAIESLNRLVQEALQRHAELLVRRRVRLVKKLAPDVPRLRVDTDRVREALSLLVSRALDAVAVAGRMRIETRRAQGCIVVEIAHDGPRPPGAALEDLDRVFGPDGGGSPGLEAARRIVADHGGELRVRSEGEWSAIIGLSLPILGNEDRRRAPDRRGMGHDRRHVPPPHATHPTRV